MKIKTFEEGADAAVQLLRALAHKGRLMILCQLVDAEKSVTDISTAVDQRQASVSQQLAILRREGLICPRRDGRTIYYRLADANTAAVIRTLYDLFCPDNPDPDQM